MAAASIHLGPSWPGLKSAEINAPASCSGVLRLSSRSRLSFGPIPRHRSEKLFCCVAEVSSGSAPSPSADPSPSASADASPSPKPTPEAPVVLQKKAGFSMKKGQIVRVDKEIYLDSVEYYAVNHPKFYKGIDYIYEDRGEILDLRNFEAGEYALVTWAGIPTSPAWLPTSMLIQSEKLSYKRR